MLSGLLLFRSVRNVKTLKDLQHYFTRRFLRIYPLYALTAVLAIFCASKALSSFHVLSELFMLRTLGFPSFNNPPAWSLYVEVCFHIFLPAFVITSGRWAHWMASLCFVILLFADVFRFARDAPLGNTFLPGIMVSPVIDWMTKAIEKGLKREVLGTILFFLRSLALLHRLPRSRLVCRHGNCCEKSCDIHRGSCSRIRPRASWHFWFILCF